MFHNNIKKQKDFTGKAADTLRKVLAGQPFAAYIRIFGLLLFSCVLFGCSAIPSAPQQSGRLKITTTIFAAYDAAKSIAGDNADITMLMSPGSEIHSYEPTPRDIIAIANSDIFICAGGEGDVWVDSILDSIDTSNLSIIRMMDCAELLEEEIIEGMETREDSDEEEEPEWDEHVWVTPANMKLIYSAIFNTCCQLKPEHTSDFQQNFDTASAAMEELDEAFRECIDNAPIDTILFADRFPIRYFVEEYGLDYYAAFPGCSDNTEASAATVAFLIKKVHSESIPTIFIVELGNGKLASVVSEETGADIATFYAGHNVSADDFNAGITYADLMKRNLEALKSALYR